MNNLKWEEIRAENEKRAAEKIIDEQIRQKIAISEASGVEFKTTEEEEARIKEIIEQKNNLFVNPRKPEHHTSPLQRYHEKRNKKKNRRKKKK